MKNVHIKKTGNKVVITIDLSKDFGPSKSGKTTVIATTSGNITIDPETQAKLGLNVYKPIQD